MIPKSLIDELREILETSGEERFEEWKKEHGIAKVSENLKTVWIEGYKAGRLEEHFACMEGEDDDE